MAVEIKVPVLGESVVEATVAKWMKSAGEAVGADEAIVELETDKVTLEVPSPVNGVLADIVAKEGDTVGVDALLALVEEGAAPTAKPAAKTAPAPAPTATPDRLPLPRLLCLHQLLLLQPRRRYYRLRYANWLKKTTLTRQRFPGQARMAA